MDWSRAASFGLLMLEPLGSPRDVVVDRIGDDAALALPQVLAGLPIVGVLDPHAQLIEPRLRHSGGQEIVLEDTFRHRSVDDSLGSTSRAPAAHLVEEPSARERGPATRALKKDRDACRAAH